MTACSPQEGVLSRPATTARAMSVAFRWRDTLPPGRTTPPPSTVRKGYKLFKQAIITVRKAARNPTTYHLKRRAFGSAE